MDTTVEELMVPSADGGATSYLARPAEGTHPAVLLIPDVFGLRPQIRDMCKRIASWGYVVLAPNIVYRQHPDVPLLPGADLRSAEAREQAMRETFGWVMAVPPEDTVRDAAAWFAWLGAQPFVRGDRFAITGYCRGGYLALLIAEGLGDRLAAAGLFHAGHLVTDAPASLHRHLDGVRAELLLRFADADPSASPEAQATLAEALDAAGVRYSSATYPDAPHGYTMADSNRYQEAAAERHYVEFRELLDRAL